MSIYSDVRFSRVGLACFEGRAWHPGHAFLGALLRSKLASSVVSQRTFWWFWARPSPSLWEEMAKKTIQSSHYAVM